MPDLVFESYFALVLIIALGILLGQIKIRGISLDNSGVLFVALLLGHLGITVPVTFQKIGIVLFIYSVGMQAGPGFFGSFRSQGRQLIYATVILIFCAAFLVMILAWMFHIEFDLAVGLLTGALSSTPGLAAATEASRSPLASIGYGIAYPFGVIGVIIFIRILPRLFQINLEDARKAYQESRSTDYPEMRGQNFQVNE